MFTKPISGGLVSPQNITRLSNVPAAATAAVNSITGVPGLRYIVHGIQWSYSAAPTGGRLTISDGATLLDLDITEGGPGALAAGIPCDSGATLTITLASGAGAVVGKLNSQVEVSGN